MDFMQAVRLYKWMLKTQDVWLEREIKMEYEYRKAIARNERMLFEKGLRWVKEKILSFKSVFKKRI